MKFDLSIPKGPKQQLFLAYLNSELSKRSLRSQAETEVAPDGSINTTVYTVFGENLENLELKWLFETSKAGELISVEVTRVVDTIESPCVDWESAASEIVTRATLSAFNERRTRTVMRRIFYYIGPQLDGEYWFRRVRLAPALEDNSFPAAMNLERVVTLDFEVESIDHFDSLYLGAEFSRRAAARFSLLLDVDLYEHAGEQVWVLDDSRNVRLNRGVCDVPFPTDMPNKGSICSAGASGATIASYGRTVGTLKMPPEARRILRGLESLPGPVQDAFDGAARMYQIGLSLSKRFPSAALAYRVAAIDALQQTEPNCNGFSEFMRRYTPSISGDEKILNYLHGDIRSSHFHAGKFDLGEFSAERHYDVVHDQDTVQRSYMHVQGLEVTREALVTWMLLTAAGASS